jgi:hypothetical protein
MRTLCFDVPELDGQVEVGYDEREFDDVAELWAAAVFPLLPGEPAEAYASFLAHTDERVDQRPYEQWQELVLGALGRSASRRLTVEIVRETAPQLPPLSGVSGNKKLKPTAATLLAYVLPLPAPAPPRPPPPPASFELTLFRCAGAPSLCSDVLALASTACNWLRLWRPMRDRCRSSTVAARAARRRPSGCFERRVSRLLALRLAALHCVCTCCAACSG